MEDCRNNHEKGQVALIMVLIMTVVGALAVSVSNRSTVGTSIQQTDIASDLALISAESGADYLSNSDDFEVMSNMDNGAYFEATKSAVQKAYIISQRVIQLGESLELYLNDADPALTDLDVYWRSGSGSMPPALFISDYRTSNVVDYAYDSTGLFGFTKVSSGGVLQGVEFTYKVTIPVVATSQKMRLMVLNNNALIGISPVGAELPDQGFVIRAVGKVGTNNGTIQRGIELSQSSEGRLPSVFDYAIFSLGSLE